MVQRGDRAPFADEALARARVVDDIGWEDFDGDRAIEARIARLVHLAHAAGANPRRYLIWPDAPSVERPRGAGVEQRGGRRREETRRTPVRVEHPLHFVAQRVLAAA